MWMILLWALVLATDAHRTPAQKTRDHHLNEEILVKAERGGSVRLPCDIESYLDDEPIKIQWFKDNTSSPFYILEDTRRRGIWNANHDISVEWAGRAFFSALSSPSSLEVSKVQTADAGKYACRVLFHGGELRTQNITLIVGVSPSKPQITDGDGTLLRGTVGPFYVGHSLRLNCIVERGDPMPTVVWRRNGIEVKHGGRYTLYAKKRLEGVHLVLDIGRLVRDELKASFTCEATNRIVEKSLSTTVTVDLILPPLSVEIEQGGSRYDAGTSAEFRCRVSGSRPFPVVTWILATRKIESFFNDISNEDDGNTTVSTLLLTMSPQENGQKLICRVSNHQLPGSTWDDSVVLNVLHRPIVHLQLGEGLQLQRLQEGSDVYFECSVAANPPLSQIQWTLDDRELPHDKDIIVQGTYLALRNVSAAKLNGRLNCDVTNPVGSVRSNDVELRIHYPPRCRPEVERFHRFASIKSPVVIRCQMDADPRDKLTFVWLLKNSTSGGRRYLKDHKLMNDSTSVLFYTPSSMSEVASIECSGNNSLNKTNRAQPCVFHVEPYGAPPVLGDCQVVNQAQSWFFLECDTSSREHLSESYQLEVRHADTNVLLANLTSQNDAVFQVRGIPDSTECIALVFAFNEKGRSEPTRVMIQAISPPSKLLTNSVVETSVTAGGIVIIALIVLISAAAS
ncbi:hemicentin-1 [Galendromus occidentalis]|uniref:Hemicentin-1 n=1 Tax=Galendromus occidentalis TaxID=34638 RepID=A0AAJ7WH25_9ACAR|nr:hemicentin-1 [Galendromus occidentalis]